MSIDDRIEEKIEALVAEEHRLQAAGGGDGMDTEQHARTEAIKVELDRLWDWKRQRQALHAAGRDPDEAHERSGAVVEHYLQ